MAIMPTTRRLVRFAEREARLEGVQRAVSSLRHFSEIESLPSQERAVLLKAAAVIEDLSANAWW